MNIKANIVALALATTLTTPLVASQRYSFEWPVTSTMVNHVGKTISFTFISHKAVNTATQVADAVKAALIKRRQDIEKKQPVSGCPVANVALNPGEVKRAHLAVAIRAISPGAVIKITHATPYSFKARWMRKGSLERVCLEILGRAHHKSEA